jgi:hypothetical protein
MKRTRQSVRLNRRAVAFLARYISETLQGEHEQAPASTAAYIANGNGVTRANVRAAVTAWNRSRGCR